MKKTPLSERDPAISATAREASRLSALIQPLLHGRGPELQGAVLADLLAMFIAGHHPGLREEILQMHLGAVRELVPVCERQIFAQHGGRPEGWSRQ
jgi:hypothetical protein